MKAIAIGIFVGLFLAGVVAPAIILALPPRLRGPSVVWSSAAVVVAGTSACSWLLSRRSQ